MVTMIAALPLTGYATFDTVTATVGTIYKAADIGSATTASGSDYVFTSDSTKTAYTNIGAPFGPTTDITLTNYPSYLTGDNATGSLTYTIDTAGTYRFSIFSVEYNNMYPTITLDDDTDTTVTTSSSTIYGSGGMSGRSFTFIQVEYDLTVGSHTITLGSPENYSIIGIMAVVLEKVSVGDVQIFTASEMTSVGNDSGSAVFSTGGFANSDLSDSEVYRREYEWIFGENAENAGSDTYGWLGDSSRGSLTKSITIPTDGYYTFYVMTSYQYDFTCLFSLTNSSDEEIMDAVTPEEDRALGYNSVDGKTSENIDIYSYTSSSSLAAGKYTFTYQSLESKYAPDFVAMAVVRNPGFGESDTDSGVYTVNETTYGVIRYLQLYSGSDSDELSEYGFYFISADDGSILTDSKIYNSGGLDSEYGGFYGDLYHITNETEGTYYAKPYVILESDTATTLYGTSISGTVDWSGENTITYEEPSSGSTE